MRSRTTTAVGALVPALLASLLTTVAAAAASPDIGMSTGGVRVEKGMQKHDDGILRDPLFSAQARSQEIADRLQQNAGIRSAAPFSAVAIDQRRNIVQLLWKGRPTQAVRDVVRAVDARIEIVTVPYSASELTDAAKSILVSPPAALKDRITSAGPRADFSGLDVGVTGDATALPRTTSSGIPLTVTGGVDIAPAWRWGDTAPFWGGSAIDRPVGDGYTYCTTAFPVRRNTGGTGILTAAHCGTNVHWRTPDNDQLVGTSGSGRPDLDSTILIDGASYGSSIYVGPWNASATSSRPVIGSGNPALNSFVFASGSWSGASTIQVTQLGQFVNLDGQIVGPGFWAVNTSGVASVGQGDSGGPVAGPNGGDTTRVIARGLISAIDLGFQGACTGMTQQGRRCSSRSFHVNITELLNGLGATVKTS